MVRFGKTAVFGLLASAASLHAQAQPAPQPPPGPARTQTQPPVRGEVPLAEPHDPASAPADAEEDAGATGEEGEEIVVTGQRQRGAVIGDIPPQIQLDPRDIRALGAGSIAEVLGALGPQTQSGRGRGGGSPVVLLNGQRISGFGEIRNIPPEAILRIDILPEEVALQYGYRADQRVVNFVLRPRFRALTGELEGGLATDGGRPSYEADLNLLRIDQNGRWELDAEYSREGALLESERDLGGEQAQFRTLLPETNRLQLSGTINRTIFNDVSATANASFNANWSESLFGLPFPDAPRPLTRNSEGRNGHLGVTLNGQVRPWRWSFTGNYDRFDNQTEVDRRDALGVRDRADTQTENANAALVVNGSLFNLPAGDVSTTFRAGAERLRLEGQSTRSGVLAETDLGRTRGNLQATFDLPLTSRRNDVLAAIGNLSANLNAEVEELSDFGTLTTLGYGLNWSPIAELSLIASLTEEEGAPTIQQLGNPVLVTPGVRVFDFTRGETVDITRVEGGNPDLGADDRRVFKLGLSLRPLAETDLSLTADYTNERVRGAIASFPTATPEIEAAFPERFRRDEGGRLLQIDSRPVNFERTNREEMRWGINLSKPIASAPPPRGAFPQRWRGGQDRGGQGTGGLGRDGQGRDGGTGTPSAAAGQPATNAPPAAGQSATNARPGTANPPATGATGAPPAGQSGNADRPRFGGGAGPGGFGGRAGFGRPGRFGGRGGFGGPGGGRGGRLQFGLFHTWRFRDTILIREGVPELDLLEGSAVGSRGGRPRHEIEAQAGIFKNGFGARLTGTWQDATQVRGLPNATGTSSDLFFSDIATVNLRLFANLGEQSIVTRNPWLRGTRVSLAVNNVINTRPQVTDAGGTTPFNYQPGFLDPLGRSVTLSIRKLLF